MKQRTIIRLTGVLVAMLMLLSVAGCRESKPDSNQSGSSQKSGESANESKSQTAPAFTLPELASGEEIEFPGDFQGRKVLMVFFSLG